MVLSVIRKPGKQARKALAALLRFLRRGAWLGHQVQHVHAGLQIGYAAGEKGVAPQVAGVDASDEEGEDARFGQRHDPRLAQVVGLAVVVHAQDESPSVERAAQQPG